MKLEISGDVFDLSYDPGLNLFWLKLKVDDVTFSGILEQDISSLFHLISAAEQLQLAAQRFNESTSDIAAPVVYVNVEDNYIPSESG